MDDPKKLNVETIPIKGTAVRWEQDGDHPLVRMFNTFIGKLPDSILAELLTLSPFHRAQCGVLFASGDVEIHMAVVKPGDYIVTLQGKFAKHYTTEDFIRLFNVVQPASSSKKTYYKD